MTAPVVLSLLVVMAIVAVAEADGLNEKAVFGFCFVAVFIGISWYFYSRRGKPPSAAETTAATAWLLVRRLVGFAGAAAFIFMSAMIGFTLYHRVNEIPLAEALAAAASALFCLGLAGLCVWVAIFGQGERRGEWRDDVALHNENKRRYRWRW